MEIYGTGMRYPNRIEIEEPNAACALIQTFEIYNFVSEQIKGKL